MNKRNFQYRYCPILAVSPSEIIALKELPDKDKTLILPVFPIKSWTTAYKLSSAIDKVQEAIGKDNKWIADIDYEDLASRDKNKFREVHMDILALTEPSNGYYNWCCFVAEHSNMIPCLQIRDLSQFKTQLYVLNSFNRGVVLILKQLHIQSGILQNIVSDLAEIDNLLIILDLEQITRERIEFKEQIKNYLHAVKMLLPKAMLSLSSTSFPDSFGGYYRGTNTIYERSLYDKIKLDIDDLIYSDRGSARATKQSGASGLPPPRIDYACKNEWHFIRKEYDDSFELMDSETKRAARKSLYTQIAEEIKLQNYWDRELALYANYCIDLTSQGGDFGIDTAQKATAVRINKHLHTQLHYDSVVDDNDTDDDWID